MTPFERVILRRDQKRFRQKIVPRVYYGLNDDPYDRCENPVLIYPTPIPPCIFQDDPIVIFDSSVKAKMNSGFLGDTDGRDRKLFNLSRRLFGHMSRRTGTQHTMRGATQGQRTLMENLQIFNYSRGAMAKSFIFQ